MELEETVKVTYEEKKTAAQVQCGRFSAVCSSPRWQQHPAGQSHRTPARPECLLWLAGPAQPLCASCPAGCGRSPPGCACPPAAGRPSQPPRRRSPGKSMAWRQEVRTPPLWSSPQQNGNTSHTMVTLEMKMPSSVGSKGLPVWPLAPPRMLMPSFSPGYFSMTISCGGGGVCLLNQERRKPPARTEPSHLGPGFPALLPQTPSCKIIRSAK